MYWFNGVRRDAKRMADDYMRHALVLLYPRLRRFAIRLAGSPIKADDLVQDACERALSRQHQWQRGTRLDSWLYRIIYNCWTDEQRSARVRKTAPLEDAANIPADEGERVIDARLILEVVCRELDNLPDEQRAVLVLVCIKGLSYREVAAILGIPIGTVMSRLARGRLALAHRIDITAQQVSAENLASSGNKLKSRSLSK